VRPPGVGVARPDGAVTQPPRVTSEHFALGDVGPPTGSSMDARLWFRVTCSAGVGWLCFPMAQVVPAEQRSRAWVLRWLNDRVDEMGREHVERELACRSGLVIG
jgi:hypothetical protein